MSTTPEGSLRLAAWLQVLERIETSVRESLPLPVEATPPTAADPAANAPLAALDQRLEGWHACLAKAERHAAEVEALVDTQPLEAWIAAARAVRERLVK
jgi:hypothetical protein